MQNIPPNMSVNSFDYMLAFAMTDYKLQGRTLPKLIISVPPSYRRPPMTLVAFYVLVSRVRRKKDLRLLVYNLPDLWKITNKQHSDNLRIYERSYTSAGIWSPSLVRSAAKRKPTNKRNKPKKKTKAQIRYERFANRKIMAFTRECANQPVHDEEKKNKRRRPIVFSGEMRSVAEE
jgi:hypothetical protein